MAFGKDMRWLGALGLAGAAALASPMGCGGGNQASTAGDAGDDAGAGGSSGSSSSSGSNGSTGGSSGGSGSGGLDATSADGSDASSGAASDASGSTSSSGSDGSTDASKDGGKDGSSASSGGSSGGSSSASSSGSSASSSGGSTSDAGVVGGVPGGKAGPGTTLAGCMIFPADNPWNTAVDGPGVRIIHDYDSQIPQATPLHPDWGDYTTHHYGIPYNVVPPSQSDQTTVFNYAADQSDPGPGGWVGTVTPTSGTTAYPFFVGMEIEGDPVPGGTPGSLHADQHALILQQGASGCTSYEAWQCVVVSAAPFRCANGAVFNLTSNALRPAGWTSADAAGLSILAGLVRLSEVKAGAINHAIRLTFNATENAYIPPATHAASSNTSPYPPMGLRLRLKASVATSSYTAASQTIMVALKTYGFIVADNGSDWYFQGDSDDGWDATAPDGKDTLIAEISADFHHLTGADFESIDSGAPVTTGL